MFNQTVVENELSKRSKRLIRFSYETYFSEELLIYRKIFIDSKDTDIKIALDALQSAQACGKLEEKYDELLTKIQQYLITKR